MKTFSNLEIGDQFILVDMVSPISGAVLPCLMPNEKATRQNLNCQCPVFRKISPCYAKNIHDGSGKKKISDVQVVIKLEK